MDAEAVAFIAAPYGFGPSSKAIAISSHLPRAVHRVFFSDGPPLEMAQRSQEFSDCFQLDFGTSLESAAGLLSSFRTLVFVNTTRFIGASPRPGQSTILVETLGWLRASRPACSHALRAYFAQRFFDHPFSADLEAMDIFHEIGAIVPKAISVESSKAAREAWRPGRAPIVHCGGLCSPAMCEGADEAFVNCLLSTLDPIGPFRLILPKHLHERHADRLPSDVSLIDCSPMTVHEHIKESSFSLTTSGIEFTYESLLLGVPTIFLPPFNASQHLQLKYHHGAHGEWVPFNLSFQRTEFEFASLHEATTEVQRAGIQGVWRSQFAEVRRFLETNLRKKQSSLLENLRLDQANAIQRVGSDGAHSVASYVLRELQHECVLL